jgi:hypothetical protein
MKENVHIVTHLDQSSGKIIKPISVSRSQRLGALTDYPSYYRSEPQDSHTSDEKPYAKGFTATPKNKNRPFQTLLEGKRRGYHHVLPVPSGLEGLPDALLHEYAFRSSFAQHWRPPVSPKAVDLDNWQVPVTMSEGRHRVASRAPPGPPFQ